MPFLHLPDFLYLLYHRTLGQYVYLDSNGTVSFSATPIGLVKTPEGWQKKAIAWERDIQKWGLVRSFTLPLQFVGDGRTIAQSIAIDQSYEADLELLIQQLTFNATGPATFSMDYVDFYRGELDLTKIEGGEIYCKLPVIEGRVQKALAAFEGTDYEIPFLPYNKVKMDGIIIRYSPQMTTFADNYFTIPTFSAVWILSMSNTSNDQEHQYLAITDVFSTAMGGAPNFSTSPDYFAEAGAPLVLELTLKLTGLLTKETNSGTGTGRILLKNQTGTTLATILDLNLSGAHTSAPFSTNSVATIPVAAGDKLFLVAEMVSSGSTGLVNLAVDESNIVIRYNARFETTYVKTMSLYELFRAIIVQMGLQLSDFSSSLLAAATHIQITAGDAIRSIEGVGIKTSFKNAYECAKVLLCAGEGIEGGQIVIEDLAHFMSVASAVDLGECVKFDWTYAENLLFNKIHIGYNSKQLEGTNGKYSFNNSHNYTLNVKKNNATLELICPFTMCPYYIEGLRINTEGKTTTDNRQDNDVMVLIVDPTTGTTSIFSLNKNVPETFASGSGDIKFESFTGNEFSPLAGQAQFAYNGTVAQSVTIGYNIKPFKSDSSNVAIRIQVNGVIVQTTTFAADGSTHGGSALVITVNPGDIIKLSLAYGGSGVVSTDINEAHMNINFTDVTTYDLLRVPYVNVDTGVPDINSLFNIEGVTPKRLLQKWLKYINSVHFQLHGEYITFQSTEKNRDLKTDDGTTVIDEDDVEVIGTDLLFKGIYFDFEDKVPTVMAADLQSNPNTGFKTTRIWGQDSDVFKGILIKAAMAPNTLEPQSFKLLAAPDTNESLLKK